MNVLQHLSIRSLLVISACACLNSLYADASSKLESNSPFLPTGYSKLKSVRPNPVPQSNSPLARDLEFRGVVQLDGVYQISLFKKSENRGYWISENGSESGISVSNFDADSMSVIVTADGRSEQLSLVSASENPLPVVATSPSVQKPQTMPSNIQLPSNVENKPPTRRTIPRRRVILPPKNN